METGFAIMRRGNLWTLRMQGTTTEGKFGSLSAAMRCAYHLTDAAIGDGADWETDSAPEIA
jgi:hypothetical protein